MYTITYVSVGVWIFDSEHRLCNHLNSYEYMHELLFLPPLKLLQVQLTAGWLVSCWLSWCRTERATIWG